MKPFIIPMVEHVARLALRRQGVASRKVGTLHVYDAPGFGTLPTTVLIHGLGAAATPFAPVLSSLRRDVKRVVAPDLPGHGYNADESERMTPARLFESLQRTLDTTLDEPAIVVGNSLGGALALQYAVERPERVRALVLVSPAGARSTDEDWRALTSSFRIASRRDARSFMARLYHRQPWFAPLVAHEVALSVGRPAVRDLLDTATGADGAGPDELAALKMPILLLWGRSERLLPEAHFEYFRTHLPAHAVIERPDGFGHCPHFDAPGALARRIVRFARSNLVATA